jgi:hypothetical protein
MPQRSGIGARARTVIVAACAGLTAVLVGLAAVRAGGGGGFMAPSRTAPGSPSDTTADLVLGQFNFTHNTPNLVDGFGLWMKLAGGRLQQRCRD